MKDIITQNLQNTINTLLNSTFKEDSKEFINLINEFVNQVAADLENKDNPALSLNEQTVFLENLDKQIVNSNVALYIVCMLEKFKIRTSLPQTTWQLIDTQLKELVNKSKKTAFEILILELKLTSEGIQNNSSWNIEENTLDAIFPAEIGYIEAQYYLGSRYFSNDEGFAINTTRAIHWLSQAASQKHADAEYRLAICYQDGEGVKKSESKKFDFMTRAAVHGNALAQQFFSNASFLVATIIEYGDPSQHCVYLAPPEEKHKLKLLKILLQNITYDFTVKHLEVGGIPLNEDDKKKIAKKLAFNREINELAALFAQKQSNNEKNNYQERINAVCAHFSDNFEHFISFIHYLLNLKDMSKQLFCIFLANHCVNTISFSKEQQKNIVSLTNETEYKYSFYNVFENNLRFIIKNYSDIISYCINLENTTGVSKKIADYARSILNFCLDTNNDMEVPAIREHLLKEFKQCLVITTYDLATYSNKQLQECFIALEKFAQSYMSKKVNVMHIDNNRKITEFFLPQKSNPRNDNLSGQKISGSIQIEELKNVRRLFDKI